MWSKFRTYPGCSALVALLPIFLGTGACVAQDDAVIGDDAREYVARLPDDCAYDDGYTCGPVTEGETQFTGEIDDNGMLSAVYLQAWNVAWQDFRHLDDFSDEQKKLKHYRVGFSQDEGNFIVVLRPLLLPWMQDGEPAGLSRGTIGPGVKYWVDKKSQAISKRLYQK